MQKKIPLYQMGLSKWNLSRLGHQEVWSQRIPTVKMLKDLGFCGVFGFKYQYTFHMSLDFMQFDKPVINTVLVIQKQLYNDQRLLELCTYNTFVDRSHKIVKRIQDGINYCY
jgi:hypothetical protein